MRSSVLVLKALDPFRSRGDTKTDGPVTWVRASRLARLSDPAHIVAMGDPAKRRATYKDLWDLPDNEIGEIIHGTLVTHPRPAAPHAVAASVLGIEIGGPFHRGKLRAVKRLEIAAQSPSRSTRNQGASSSAVRSSSGFRNGPSLIR